MTTIITEIKAHADPYPGVSFPYWHCSVENSSGLPFRLMPDCMSSHYENTEEHVSTFRAMLGELLNHDVEALVPADIRVEFRKFEFFKQSSGRYMNPKHEGALYFTIYSNDRKDLISSGMEMKCYYTGATSSDDCLSFLKEIFSEQFHEALDNCDKSIRA